ncbi:restriction endonuclease subunit S [Ciceribacter sp. L1K23]|uniref:restriction endonuclease subunit S n=1 Tax=Ciceribacter sp. L1K23 TaxID=2820276 RepID=UPI001B821AF2|nr:restriction endonuclease subunit S [Ciceribacter sp. L1K23]MBR0557480.1 restriction endonuclease subunit S [Ciceribacter sp. L1K23]
MNAERLLQHYEQIADAPDAIARLRQFILDLAVRGKLVPQDPADEAASELLTSIAAAKARLVKAGKNGKSKTSLPVPSEQVPFSVPDGWVLTRLGDIIILLSGQHLQPSEYSEVAGAGVPYITGPSDFTANGLRISRYALVRKAVARKGQLLLTVKGSGVGKTTICDLNEVAISRQLMSLTPIGWDLRFLEVITHRLATALQSQARSLIPGIAREDVEDFVFPLPPLAEQHRIVAKVDELMALCDELEAARTERETKRDRLAAASLARLNTPDPETFRDDARFALDALPALTARPDQIKQLRQTILNLAVRGKLVPQDPADEPAEELLKRIAGKKADKTRRAELRRNGLPDASLRREEGLEPCNWTWTQLGEVALSMRYGTSVKCDYGTKGAPVLRIPNVAAGRISLDDIKFGPLSPTEIQDLSLLAGDILLIRSNGSLEIVGRAAVVTPDAIGMSFAGYLVRLRTDPTEIDPAYIWLALQSSEVRDQIEQPIRSAVGLKNVNLTEFGALTFRLPPLAEQHRIVAKVDELMALCDQLETSLTSADETRKKLLDALLAEALAPVNAEALQEAAE